MSKRIPHTYVPRGSAKALFAMRDPQILVCGPAGTGKSRACLEKLHAMCLANPNMRALIVRKTASSLTSSAMITFKQSVASESIEAGHVTWYGGSASESPSFRYTNGATVTLAGMDNPTRVMSTEYDLIYVQEAIELTEQDWDNLCSRLRNGVVSFQQIIADTNPDVPTHWLKVRCDQGRIKMLYSLHEENPRFFTEDGELTEAGRAYIEGVLDNYTGSVHARLRRGEWVASEGAIYEEFSSAVHVIDLFDIPADWTRYWSVDFGFTNPTVIQWWAEDPDGHLYLYRELYHTKRTTDDLARQALSLVTDAEGNWTEPKPRAVLADHDSENRETLQRALGLSTTPADKKVQEGIQAVQRRLRPREDGTPGLYLMRGALVERDQALVNAKKPTCTIEEMPGYVWDVGANKAIKEAPLKTNDHGCDALRYLVMHLEARPENRIRWIG